MLKREIDRNDIWSVGMGLVPPTWSPLMPLCWLMDTWDTMQASCILEGKPPTQGEFLSLVLPPCVPSWATMRRGASSSSWTTSTFTAWSLFHSSSIISLPKRTKQNNKQRVTTHYLSPSLLSLYLSSVCITTHSWPSSCFAEIDLWDGVFIRLYSVPHRSEYTDAVAVSINDKVLATVCQGVCDVASKHLNICSIMSIITIILSCRSFMCPTLMTGVSGLRPCSWLKVMRYACWMPHFMITRWDQHNIAENSKLLAYHLFFFFYYCWFQELPGRDLTEIPHPLAMRTVKMFAHLLSNNRQQQLHHHNQLHLHHQQQQQHLQHQQLHLLHHHHQAGEQASSSSSINKKRIILTHLNHSNPLCDPNSEQAKYVASLGFEVAQEMMEIQLWDTCMYVPPHVKLEGRRRKKERKVFCGATDCVRDDNGVHQREERKARSCSWSVWECIAWGSVGWAQRERRLEKEEEIRMRWMDESTTPPPRGKSCSCMRVRVNWRFNKTAHSYLFVVDQTSLVINKCELSSWILLHRCPTKTIIISCYFCIFSYAAHPSDARLGLTRGALGKPIALHFVALALPMLIDFLLVTHSRMTMTFTGLSFIRGMMAHPIQCGRCRWAWARGNMSVCCLPMALTSRPIRALPSWREPSRATRSSSFLSPPKRIPSPNSLFTSRSLQTQKSCNLIQTKRTASQQMCQTQMLVIWRAG